MHKCIHSFWQYCQNSCNIARIAAILPELLQYRQNSGNTYLHAKSSMQCCSNIAAILPLTVAAILPQYCGKILPEGLYFDKGKHDKMHAQLS